MPIQSGLPLTLRAMAIAKRLAIQDNCSVDDIIEQALMSMAIATGCHRPHGAHRAKRVLRSRGCRIVEASTYKVRHGRVFPPTHKG
jgi:hypothetical protein